MSSTINKEQVQKKVLGILLIILFFTFQSVESRTLYHPQSSEFPDAPFELVRHRPLAQKIQKLTFETSDHLKLTGWYVPAQNNKETVLFAHGNGGHMGDRWMMMESFINRGYGVFCFDYRGYGGNPGQPSETGLYDDFLSATDYLKETLHIPESRQIAVGESLGGGVAIYAATQRDYRALMVFSTFTSTPDTLNYILSSYHFGFLNIIHPELIIQQKFPSLSRAPQITEPFLTAHGKNDQLTAPDMSNKLYNAIGSKYMKKLFIDSAGHNDIFFVGSPELLGALDELLAASKP